LIEQINDGTPIADLAKDSENQKFSSPSQLLRILLKKRASPEARKAFHEAHEEWECYCMYFDELRKRATIQG
jgi:hypothetical protein